MNEIDNYIAEYPEEIQKILKNIRLIIRRIAPESAESIAYGIPAYKINAKPLVYFAAFKNHIGFYATPSGNIQSSKELSIYKHGKGAIQFQLNEPIPYELIEGE